MSPKFRAYIITALKTLIWLQLLGGIIMGFVEADASEDNAFITWLVWTLAGFAGAALTGAFTIFVDAAHWYITGKEPTEDED